MASLPELPANYAAALKLIDDAHAEDPKTIAGENGEEAVPYELHYARKMTRWLAKRCPDASPALQLACRAQHFRRWEIPRSTYPATRAGYLSWRSKQKTVAASRLQSLLSSSSSSSLHPPPLLPSEAAARVAALVRKENLAADPETQALEDVACLVFLDDRLDGFEAARADVDDEAKTVAVLRKTWAKMSPAGRALALAMEELSERAKVLVGKALAA
ncbi:glutamyl-tRNA synthetase [Xylariomycetidae sp. FL0641]|nr:glutamyl-tRNA synthetase [Xylariomycetidae sp. FL0641]